MSSANSGTAEHCGRWRRIRRASRRAQYISLICHVTPADIKTHLLDGDGANGFANRFLWIAVRQSKYLPHGGDFDDPEFLRAWAPIRARLTEALAFGRQCGQVKKNKEARDMWEAIYPELTAGQSGSFGAIISRAAPQVLRIAMIYALLDHSVDIGPKHLLAALALWKYAADSARFLFGDRFGDADSEKLLATLRAKPEGLTRTEITVKVFCKRKSKAEISRELSDLLTRGEIYHTEDRSGTGRPVTRWFAGRAASRRGQRRKLSGTMRN